MGRKRKLTGGEKAARTAKLRYGEDYHRRIGKMGGNPLLLMWSKNKGAAGVS